MLSTVSGKSKPTFRPKNTAIRLSPEDQEIIEGLKLKTGLDFPGIVRLALRRLAELELQRQSNAAD